MPHSSGCNSSLLYKRKKSNMFFFECELSKPIDFTPFILSLQCYKDFSVLFRYISTTDKRRRNTVIIIMTFKRDICSTCICSVGESLGWLKSRFTFTNCKCWPGSHLQSWEYLSIIPALYTKPGPVQLHCPQKSKSRGTGPVCRLWPQKA